MINNRYHADMLLRYWKSQQTPRQLTDQFCFAAYQDETKRDFSTMAHFRLCFNFFDGFPMNFGSLRSTR